MEGTDALQQCHSTLRSSQSGHSLGLLEDSRQQTDLFGCGLRPRVGHGLSSFSGPCGDGQTRFVGPSERAEDLAEQVEGGFGPRIQTKCLLRQRQGLIGLTTPEMNLCKTQGPSGLLGSQSRQGGKGVFSGLQFTGSKAGFSDPVPDGGKARKALGQFPELPQGPGAVRELLQGGRSVHGGQRFVGI